MKKFKGLIFTLAVLICSSVMVFAAAADEQAFEQIKSVTGTTTICGGVVYRDWGNYTDAMCDSLHVPIGCTGNSSTASSTIYRNTVSSWPDRTDCYAGVAVFDFNGVHTGLQKYKTPLAIQSTATASVNVSGVSVGSVLHMGQNHVYCDVGQHNYLIYK